jgi:hypothetical protein
MISVITRKGEQREFYCLSTDTKPTETDYAIGNADLLLEIDTGTVYLYDADGQEWKQVT